MASLNRIGAFIDKWFISEKVKTSILDHWKAKLLVTVHFLIVIIALGLLAVHHYALPTENNPPLEYAIYLLPPAIYIFKKWGSLVLSGNLLCALTFYVLAVSVVDTGGLFSDNLLWMVIVPLIALLFANRTSGLSWLLAISLFAGYLFLTGNYSPQIFHEQIAKAGEAYYLVSYTGIFVITVFIVMFFATGQSMIIKALDDKQKELVVQKAELAQQAESLRVAQKKLEAINFELEQFAYAASHDLKEPLRMIKMYTQFIQKRLIGRLDDSTTEYMGFVTDGVSRMEKLLTDLLEYSRLGKGNRKVADTNLNEVLLIVINNMTASMKETEAEVLCNELPVIKETSTEMVQLFQNLISNSIKFRQNDVEPVIEIKHVLEDGEHRFHFSDNGIGIPKEASEKVFKIFERIHGRSEYEGTGIGLATCKKIIDNLGGEIWVEPGEVKGTTFHFTIPEERVG